MKYLIITLCMTLTFGKASAQNYADSNITVQLTQRSAYWIGQYIQTSFNWKDRLAPDVLRPYVGSGTKPDSIFTVSMRASYLTGLLERLLSVPTAVAYEDYNAIIYNQPAVVGYVALANQVVIKANGNTSEKQVSQWVVDYYNRRMGDYGKLYTEQKNNVIKWSNQ